MEDNFKKECTDKYKYCKWDFRNDVASSIESIVLFGFNYDLKVILLDSNEMITEYD